MSQDWRFSLGAIVILALGIGANTAVFSLLNSSLFQPHPFADSGRLVNIYQNETKKGEPEGVSYPAFLDLQQETSVFAAVTAAQMDAGRYQALDAEGRRGTIRSGLMENVSANCLEVLGLRPSLGRWFSAEEERRGEAVAVLGWQVWQRDFGGDPEVLGRTLIAGGTPVQVIGVGPRELNSTQSNFIVTSLWRPIPRSEPGPMEDRGKLLLQVRARLREGVTLQQARAAMEVTARRMAADYPESDPRRGMTVLASDEVHVHPRERQLRPAATVLLTVVGLVLAIACSNLATLLLVRSSARSGEISVRLALGATRWQLVRQLVVESLLQSLAGAAAGIALAHWGLRYLRTIELPVILSMQLDYRVLGFAVVVATACGIGFGLTPALQATRVDVAGALREEKGSSGAALSLTRGWFTLKNGLVAGQVAASFLLLAGAVLAMSVVVATQERSVGYRPEGLAIVATDPKYAGYDMARAAAVLDELRSRVAALPGVESAMVTTGLPVDGEFDTEFQLEAGTAAETFKVDGRFAGPGYFKTVGVAVQFGRVFDEGDTSASAEVIVVSEAFARRYFGTANAVAKQIRFADGDRGPAEIVGVVGNARSIDMVADAPQKFLYRSAAQAGVMPTTLVARTARNERELVGTVQQEVRRLHPELPVTQAITMKQRQAMELAPFRIVATFLGILGGLGLLLAGVGLYAVVAYAVAQRSREIGIRIALGARPGDVTLLVVRDVTALVAAGIVAGAALTWTGVMVLESSVVQIVGVEPWALAPVALMIVACGAGAAYVPARRAVRADPMAAMRHQ